MNLHHVLDNWFHNTWYRRNTKGDAIIIRYADHFVRGFQYMEDTKLSRRDPCDRLAQHGLELHPPKTRFIEIGRHAEADRKVRGQGKPGTSDFLGMTHFCDQSRNERFRIGRKSARKRVNRTLRRITQALRKRWHDYRHETARWLGRDIDGWLNNAVPGNGRHLESYIHRYRVLL